MLFNPDTTTCMYENVDPRNLLAGSSIKKNSTTSTGAASSNTTMTLPLQRHDQATGLNHKHSSSRSSSTNPPSSSSTSSTTKSTTTTTTTSIPKRYQAVQIKHSKRGLDDFDFSLYNNTSEYVGFENSLPNSYTNAVLVLLYHIPEVRSAVLNHLCNSNKEQEKDVETKDEDCLCCELMFLFHMIDIAKHERPAIRSCQSTNFLRVFKQVPEVAALGLLDRQDRKSNKIIETFYWFLLNYIDAKKMKQPVEREEEKKQLMPSLDALSLSDKEFSNSNSVVEDLFGFEMCHQDYCCNTTNYNEKPHCTSRISQVKTIELTYPATINTSTTPPPSFSTLLFNSLTKSSRVLKTWCKECNGYQLTNQTRRPLSLPKVLNIQCNMNSSSDSSNAIWKSFNSRGGSFLPFRIKLCISSKEEDGQLCVLERLESHEGEEEEEEDVQHWIASSSQSNGEKGEVVVDKAMLKSGKEYVLCAVVFSINEEQEEEEEEISNQGHLVGVYIYIYYILQSSISYLSTGPSCL